MFSSTHALCTVVDSAVSAPSVFLLFWRIVGIWLSITVISVALFYVVAISHLGLLRIKNSLAEADGTLPLPFHDRRKQARYVFRPQMTRRDLRLAEGVALERLHHSIDYLIQTYNLRRFAGEHRGPQQAEFTAVEILLRCRAEMLGGRPPLPSFSYLLSRKVLYWIHAVRKHV
jgi:hypothetical protein